MGHTICDAAAASLDPEEGTMEITIEVKAGGLSTNHAEGVGR
ncbi:hypothetical protein [Patulibacter defluvii]|nr:hypothetical protein [Patulibacter sp. DM4]